MFLILAIQIASNKIILGRGSVCCSTLLPIISKYFHFQIFRGFHMSQFFSLDGSLMSALERIANLALINILWLLCSIFILPLGPATEAMCYCTMKVLKNEDSHLICMFFRELKDNFLKKMLAGLLLLLVGTGLYFQYRLVFDWQSDLSSNVKIIAGVPMATVALIYLSQPCCSFRFVPHLRTA